MGNSGLLPGHSESLPFQWPLRPRILSYGSVRLEPVDPAHFPALAELAGEEDIWRYMTYARLTDADSLRRWIDTAAQANALGTELNFAIVDERSGKAVGGTSFYRVVPEHRRLELGKTWIGAPYRRSHVNTTAKYLMLQHAFESIGANRVELNTDIRNLRSQRAIERIGAMRDGVLRAHTIMHDGFIRDTVNYSVTFLDWPVVKARLATMIEGSVSRMKLPEK
jgi:RimJ/RimL family protein N-acetyltransferase